MTKRYFSAISPTCTQYNVRVGQRLTSGCAAGKNDLRPVPNLKTRMLYVLLRYHSKKAVSGRGQNRQLLWVKVLDPNFKSSHLIRAASRRNNRVVRRDVARSEVPDRSFLRSLRRIHNNGGRTNQNKQARHATSMTRYSSRHGFRMRLKTSLLPALSPPC